MSLFKALGGLAAPTSSANGVGLASGARSGGAFGLQATRDTTDTSVSDPAPTEPQPSLNPDPRNPTWGQAA